MDRIRSLKIASACVLMALLVSPAIAGTRKVGWSDLMAGKPGSKATDATNSSQALDGEAITLDGYLLPADREGELVYSFMLVPRRGACSHMTQPPASQVVRVVPKEPYRLSINYERVSISGTLQAGHELTQLFILDGVAVIESGYTMRGAQVMRQDLPSNPAAQRPATPWSFLNDRMPK